MKKNTVNGNPPPLYSEKSGNGNPPSYNESIADKPPSYNESQFLSLRSPDQRILHFNKLPYYSNYSNFFDHNIEVYEKLKDKFEQMIPDSRAHKNMKKRLNKMESTLDTLISKINELESSVGFQKLSSEAKDCTRKCLTLSLNTNQDLDLTRRNPSYTKVIKSAAKLLGYSGLTVGVSALVRLAIPLPLPGVRGIVEKAILDLVVPIIAGASMKDIIVKSAIELSKDFRATINPTKYLEKDIEKKISSFDVNKVENIYQNAVSASKTIESAQEMLNADPENKKLGTIYDQIRSKAENEIMTNVKEAGIKSFKKIEGEFEQVYQDSKSARDSKIEIHSHHASDLLNHRNAKSKSHTSLEK